jgi:hypothetical protein
MNSRTQTEIGGSDALTIPVSDCPFRKSGLAFAARRLSSKSSTRKNPNAPPGGNFFSRAQRNLTPRVVMPASASSSGDYIKKLS